MNENKEESNTEVIEEKPRIRISVNEMEEIDKLSYIKNEINNRKKVLLYFYSNSCGPCVYTSNLIDSIERDINQDIIKTYEDFIIMSVNVESRDDNEDRKEINKIIKEYNVQLVPTIIIYEDAKIIKVFFGKTNHIDIDKYIVLSD